MPNRTSQTMMLPDFEHLLDVFGADRTRWPLSARAGAAALVAVNADARRMLAEAAALDAVLAQGSEQQHLAGDAPTAALAARIVAAAASTPRIVASTPAAIMAPAPAPKRSQGAVRASSHRAAAQFGTDTWRGAALLAASLMIGVFVGQSQFGAQTLPQLAALAGVSVGTAERIALADIDVEATDVD